MAANVALFLWLCADALRLLLLSRNLESDIFDAAAGVALLVVAARTLFRPPPIAQDARLGTLALAFAAAIFPAVLAVSVPSEDNVPTWLLIVQALAILIMIAGLLQLGRNFSVVPQYRYLVIGGPYALVRHPVYASYLVFDASLVAGTGSLFFFALWALEFALLFWRIEFEEALLLKTAPGYADYKTRVRWRLIPWVV